MTKSQELKMLKWSEGAIYDNKDEPMTEDDFWCLVEDNLAIYAFGPTEDS